jgi:hypothetical protein
MYFIYKNNTLANPTEVVGTSTMTRQEVLTAIDSVFAEHGFDRMDIMDGPYGDVVAFGAAMQDSKRGVGLEVRAAPSACGTGIVFDVAGKVNYSGAWQDPSMEYPERCHHWSTSERLIQFGAPRAMNPKFIKGLHKHFRASLHKQEETAAAREAAARVSERLGASKNGTLVGTDFVCQVSPAIGNAEVELTVRTTDVNKIQAILALLRTN